MARPVVFTIDGTDQGNGASVTPYWEPNRHITPFAIGFGVVVSGTITYSIQHTFDEIGNPAVTPVWFTHPQVSVTIGNADGNYAFPVRGIRGIRSAGTGSAQVTFIQAGIAN
jgi:hypothetical protein